ncbi:putative quinone oxidoreductase YhfP [compost metagenome]
MPTIKYGGAVAASGVTGGADLALTVFPFIIRGVKLLGIDSVMVAMDKRMKVWELLAGTYKPDMLEDMCKEIGLEQLGDQVEVMLRGESRGRMVVKL